MDIGLTFFQIGILFSLSSLSAISFEIPTGVVADIFGRKTSVLIRFFLCGITSILVAFTNSFLLLCIIFIFWGFAATFYSGAFESWIIDYLEYKKQNKLIHSAFSRIESFTNAGAIIAFIMAGFLIFIGLKWIWIIEGVGSIFIGLFLLLFSKEPYQKNKIKKFNLQKLLNQIFNTGKEAIKYSFSHNTLLYLIIASSLAGIGYGIIILGWQPFFKELNIPIQFFGLILACVSIVGIVEANLSKRFVKKLKNEKYALIGIRLINIIGTLTLALTISPIIAIISFFILDTESLEIPIFTTYFNKFTPSKIRASINSVLSMFTNIAAILASLVFGLLADIFGLRFTFLIALCFFVMAIPIYLRIKG